MRVRTPAPCCARCHGTLPLLAKTAAPLKRQQQRGGWVLSVELQPVLWPWAFERELSREVSAG
jgi:hypothetical protein